MFSEQVSDALAVTAVERNDQVQAFFAQIDENLVDGSRSQLGHFALTGGKQMFMHKLSITTKNVASFGRVKNMIAFEKERHWIEFRLQREKYYFVELVLFLGGEQSWHFPPAKKIVHVLENEGVSFQLGGRDEDDRLLTVEPSLANQSFQIFPPDVSAVLAAHWQVEVGVASDERGHLGGRRPAVAAGAVKDGMTARTGDDVIDVRYHLQSVP